MGSGFADEGTISTVKVGLGSDMIWFIGSYTDGAWFSTSVLPLKFLHHAFALARSRVYIFPRGAMTTNQIIAVIAFVVPSGTALIVAYLHRKLLRQIEEFRRDPTVGLQPPANPVWAWIKRRRDLLSFAAVGIPLLLELFRNGPVTRWTVFIVAFDLTVIGFMILMIVIQKIYETISRLVNAFGMHLETHTRQMP
jgi:hypothetical protein